MYSDCELPHSRHLYRCFPAFVLPFYHLVTTNENKYYSHNPPPKTSNFFSNLDGSTYLYAVIFTTTTELKSVLMERQLRNIVLRLHRISKKKCSKPLLTYNSIEMKNCYNKNPPHFSEEDFL